MLKACDTRFKIKQEKKILSHEHLQMWPFICSDRGERMLLVWYQYSSSTSPEPSDVYVSASGGDGVWAEPVRVSEGGSFNNGPSLAALDGGRVAVYWHSWRKPGTQPFHGSGGVTYIWGSVSEDGTLTRWEKPFLVFSGEGKQLYPSITRDLAGKHYMVYSKGYGESLGIAFSDDGMNWRKGEDVVGYNTPNRPDIAVDKDGVMWIVFSAVENNKRRIFLIRSEDGVVWKEQGLGVNLECDLDRPKINIDNSGECWITFQSDYWKTRTFSQEIRSDGGKMVFKFESDGSRGNHCWAVNALRIENLETEDMTSFRFSGRNVEDTEGYVSVFDDHIYEKGKGFGFTRKVASMKRLIGDEVASNFVYGDEPSEFIVEITPGRYKITATVSPWLSSRLGTRLTVNDNAVSQAGEAASSIFIGRLDRRHGNGEFSSVVNGSDLERTRPSRIVKIGGKYFITWNYFSEAGQGIALGRVVEGK